MTANRFGEPASIPAIPLAVLTCLNAVNASFCDSVLREIEEQPVKQFIRGVIYSAFIGALIGAALVTFVLIDPADVSFSVTDFTDDFYLTMTAMFSILGFVGGALIYVIYGALLWVYRRLAH